MDAAFPEQFANPMESASVLVICPRHGSGTMTRKSKKEHEKRFVTSFLEDFEYTSLDEDERPDFRVRRTDGDFVLEVTEYHSQSVEGSIGRPRVAIEAAWRRYLEPAVNAARRAKPSLRNIRVFFDFAEKRVPGRAQAAECANEMVTAVESLVTDPRFTGREATITFSPRATIASMRQSLGIHDSRSVLFFGKDAFLAHEDYSLLSDVIGWLKVSVFPLDWPPWSCLSASTAWVSPQSSEFKRILEGKAKAATEYTLNGMPLWLLILCDAVDDGGEAHGDLTSHIFPCDDGDEELLAAALTTSGFDFENGPFREIWLFSCFNGNRLRIHPMNERP